MFDVTNQSDPAPAPPVARSSLPTAGGRPLRRRLFQLGSAGAGSLIVAAVACLCAHGSSAPPARAGVEEGAPLRIEGRSIVLTPRLEAALGLRITAARLSKVSPLVTTTGTVTFDPRHTAAVGTRIPGIVRSVSRFEGDVVRPGEGLAVIEGAELGTAQADVLSLRASEHAAERSFAREVGLGARGLSSARRMEAAAARFSVVQSTRVAAEHRVAALGGESAPSRLGVHRVASPIAGTIVERHVSAGQSVEDHRVAFRVANLDHLWVELSVVEAQVRGIQAADPVEVCASPVPASGAERGPQNEPENCVKGSVAHVGEQVDASNLVVPVRIEVNNSARRLRAGQAVSARIRPSARDVRSRVVVPRSAIVSVDGQPLVFVQVEAGRVVPTKVELAESDESDQGLIGGISAGQNVVSAGAAALRRAMFR